METNPNRKWLGIASMIPWVGAPFAFADGYLANKEGDKIGAAAGFTGGLLGMVPPIGAAAGCLRAGGIYI